MVQKRCSSQFYIVILYIRLQFIFARKTVASNIQTPICNNSLLSFLTAIFSFRIFVDNCLTRITSAYKFVKISQWIIVKVMQQRCAIFKKWNWNTDLLPFNCVYFVYVLKIHVQPHNVQHVLFVLQYFLYL